jgi:hypothetical protein
MLYYKLMAKPALVALLALAVRACPSSETTQETSLFNRSAQQTPDRPSIDPIDPQPTPTDPPPAPTDVPPVTGSTPTDPSTKMPFDGGLSILLATGAAYGAKKAVDYRKSLKSKSDKG